MNCEKYPSLSLSTKSKSTTMCYIVAVITATSPDGHTIKAHACWRQWQEHAKTQKWGTSCQPFTGNPILITSDVAGKVPHNQCHTCTIWDPEYKEMRENVLSQEAYIKSFELERQGCEEVLTRYRNATVFDWVLAEPTVQRLIEVEEQLDTCRFLKTGYEDFMSLMATRVKERQTELVVDYTMRTMADSTDPPDFFYGNQTRAFLEEGDHAPANFPSITSEHERKYPLLIFPFEADFEEEEEDDDEDDEDMEE